MRIVRPAVSLPVPEMRLHPGPPLFSVHAKLRGEHLFAEHYRALPEVRRAELGEALGRFYAELHRLEPAMMERAGARRVLTWQSADVIRARAIPALVPELRGRAMEAVGAYERLSPDP